MPSPQAEAIGAVHAATQRDLAERTAAAIVAAWIEKMQDRRSGIVPDLRAAADSWLALSVPLIMRARAISAQRARGFYVAQRRLELPDEPMFEIPRPEPIDRKVIASSLWVVGPRQYVDVGRAVDDIFSEERVNAITGAAARHTLNGGREIIDSAFLADIRAVGYYRTEDSDPCYFCAALMSRGTVYKEDSFDDSDARYFGPGDAKVHDHCGGGLAPVYSDDPFPGGTAEYGQLWKQFKYENKGPDDLEAWRKWLDAHRAAA